MFWPEASASLILFYFILFIHSKYNRQPENRRLARNKVFLKKTIMGAYTGAGGGQVNGQWESTWDGAGVLTSPTSSVMMEGGDGQTKMGTNLDSWHGLAIGTYSIWN